MVDEQIKFKKLVLVYKALNGIAPEYMKEMFCHVQDVHNVNLRSASNNNLYLPRPKTEYVKRALSYDGAAMWNHLPCEVKSSTTLSSFKRNCTKYLMSLRQANI